MICQASDLGGTRQVAGWLRVGTDVNQLLFIQVMTQKWFETPKVYFNNVTRQSVEEKTHSESKGILCTKF